jgi:hypothetical protein
MQVYTPPQSIFSKCCPFKVPRHCWKWKFLSRNSSFFLRIWRTHKEPLELLSYYSKKHKSMSRFFLSAFCTIWNRLSLKPSHATVHLKVVSNEKGGGWGGWLLFEDGFGPLWSMSVYFLMLPSSFLQSISVSCLKSPVNRQSVKK